MADDNKPEEPKSDDVKLEDDADDELGAENRSTKRSNKYDDPPIVYNDVDGCAAIKKILELISGSLSKEDQTFLSEWGEYLKSEKDAWFLDHEHIEALTKLLNNDEGKYPPNIALLALEVLQTAALREDFILILHDDRKDHRLMSYLYRIEYLTLAEQEEIAKLICNFFAHPSASDWLIYISEWSEKDGTTASNCRVTTRAAVQTLLNDKLTTLQRTGINLIFNLSLKSMLFEDTATELATAVLQYLQGQLEEDTIFLCLTSLYRFMVVSQKDVCALYQMLGPDVSNFKGKSDRIDKVIEQIIEKTTSIRKPFSQLDS